MAKRAQTGNCLSVIRMGVAQNHSCNEHGQYLGGVAKINLQRAGDPAQPHGQHSRQQQKEREKENQRAEIPHPETRRGQEQSDR